MPDRRTELRDELAILIATGRELTPDHDQALADVFVDRLVKNPREPSLGWRLAAGLRKPRRLLGAAVLGLAVLGLGSALSIVDTGVSGGANSQARANVLVMPKMPNAPKILKAPFIPPSKLAHALPGPKVKALPGPKVKAVP